MLLNAATGRTRVMAARQDPLKQEAGLGLLDGFVLQLPLRATAGVGVGLGSGQLQHTHAQAQLTPLTPLPQTQLHAPEWETKDTGAALERKLKSYDRRHARSGVGRNSSKQLVAELSNASQQTRADPASYTRIAARLAANAAEDDDEEEDSSTGPRARSSSSSSSTSSSSASKLNMLPSRDLTFIYLFLNGANSGFEMRFAPQHLACGSRPKHVSDP